MISEGIILTFFLVPTTLHAQVSLCLPGTHVLQALVTESKHSLTKLNASSHAHLTRTQVLLHVHLKVSHTNQCILILYTHLYYHDFNTHVIMLTFLLLLASEDTR